MNQLKLEISGLGSYYKKHVSILLECGHPAICSVHTMHGVGAFEEEIEDEDGIITDTILADEDFEL